MDARSQILRETTRLMAAHGAAGTSIQDVADAVGLRKASVLHHFPSKDILRRAVIDALLSRWADVLPRLLLSGHQDPEARLDAVLGEFVSFFGDDPNRARLLLRELLDRPAELEQYLAETVAPWLSVVTLALDAAKQRGRVRADLDPPAFAIHLIGLVLTSFATADAIGPLLEGDLTAKRARIVAELGRVARASLFPDGGPHGELLRR